MRRGWTWLVLGVVLFVSPLSGQSPFITQVVICGDSLCDDGNLYELTGFPPSPPYFDGRFSNGPVWAEHLAASLELTSATTNIAVGFATTEEMRDLQLLPHLAAFGVDPNGLYVLWAGANDLIDAADPENAIVLALGNIADCLIALASAGAQNIMVPNLPNLGRTPYVIALGPDAVAGAELISLAFNSGLRSVIQSVEDGFGIDVVEPSAFSLLETVVNQPVRFGFTDVDSPALDESLSVVTNPDDYVFWDPIHPTRITMEIAGDNWTVQLAAQLARRHLLHLHATGAISTFGRAFVGSELNAALVRVSEVRPQQATNRLVSAAVRALVLSLLGVLDVGDAAPFFQSAALANTAVSTSLLD